MPKKGKTNPRTGAKKEKVRAWAKKENRKVLWKDEKGHWHAATNRANTPFYAIEIEDL